MAEIRDFLLTITGWGESGKAILQVSIKVFRVLSKKILGKDGSAPLEKIGPYTYDRVNHFMAPGQIVSRGLFDRFLLHTTNNREKIQPFEYSQI